MSEDKVRREPIILDKNIVALIHIFERHDDLEDVWMREFGTYVEDNNQQYEKSAQQFVSQLRENWTVAFMQHLAKEIFKEVDSLSKESAEILLSQLKEINDKRKI